MRKNLARNLVLYGLGPALSLITICTITDIAFERVMIKTYDACVQSRSYAAVVPVWEVQFKEFSVIHGMLIQCDGKPIVMHTTFDLKPRGL